MKIIEISSFYKYEKLTELIKGLQNQKPFVILAKSGKRILVSHGKKDGTFLLEKEYSGLYDEVYCCWKDTNEINYITFRQFSMAEENEIIKKWYLIQAPTSELNNLNDINYILQSIKSGIVE